MGTFLAAALPTVRHFLHFNNQIFALENSVKNVVYSSCSCLMHYVTHFRLNNSFTVLFMSQSSIV